MAIAFVQAAKALTNSSVTTQAVTWSGNTTTGNFIVLCFGTVTNVTSAITSITDSQSNTYTRAVGSNVSSAAIEIWYAQNITGGVTPTVTVTLTTGRPLVTVTEFSGVALVDALDSVGSAVFSATTAYSVGPITKNRSSNTLVIGHTIANSAGSWTVGSGYSNLTQQVASTTGAQGVESKVVSIADEQVATMTLSTSSLGRMTIATFSDVPVAQPSTFNNFQFARSSDGISVTEKIR